MYIESTNRSTLALAGSCINDAGMLRSMSSWWWSCCCWCRWCESIKCECVVASSKLWSAAAAAAAAARNPLARPGKAARMLLPVPSVPRSVGDERCCCWRCNASTVSCSIMPDGGSSLDGEFPSEGCDGGLTEPDDDAESAAVVAALAPSVAVNDSNSSFECCSCSGRCCRSLPLSSISPSVNEEEEKTRVSTVEREKTLNVFVYSNNRLKERGRCARTNVSNNYSRWMLSRSVEKQTKIKQNLLMHINYKFLLARVRLRRGWGRWTIF